MKKWLRVGYFFGSLFVISCQTESTRWLFKRGPQATSWRQRVLKADITSSAFNTIWTLNYWSTICLLNCYIFGILVDLLHYLKIYTFHINLYDIAFFGTLFIAFTLAFLLWFARKSNQAANRFLAITVAIATIWIGQTEAIDLKLFRYNSIWGLLSLHYSLAIGPLLYFYVQQIIYPEYKFRRQDLLHFVPVLLELSFYFFLVAGISAG